MDFFSMNADFLILKEYYAKNQAFDNTFSNTNNF